MTIPTTLTARGGATPTRGELEADPLAVAFLQAFAAMTQEIGNPGADVPDLDDHQTRGEVAILVRHLHAAGVQVAPC